MTEREMRELRDGDIVRHNLDGEAYIVMANCGELGVIVAKTLLVKNPDEWTLHSKNEANIRPQA